MKLDDLKRNYRANRDDIIRMARGRRRTTTPPVVIALTPS